MTRDEYNAAHVQIERAHRATHKANAIRHGRPKKFVRLSDGRLVRTYEFLAWVQTPAARSWGEDRTSIFDEFRQKHVDLKAAHPEHDMAGLARESRAVG
jgi:hypothetical protein